MMPSAMRYVYPALGLWIVLRCGTDLLKDRHNAVRTVITLLLITLFQGLNCFHFLCHGAEGNEVAVVFGYGGLAIIQWSLLLAYLLSDIREFALESLLFFLCTVGIGAVAVTKPEEIVKQMGAIGIGVMLYTAIGWLVSNRKWTGRVGNAVAALGVILLIVTLLYGEEHYGAKSWVTIGPISVQPSEISKVCFVYAGAAFMCRGKRGMAMLMIYAVIVCACLIWMNDFGGAVLFFSAFLVMVLLRNGVFTALSLAALGIGTVWWRMPPHALRRFAMWRHIWEHPLTGGYQQTRSLMCIASGGVLGLGIGSGKMGEIFAADSDMVIATVCETWGLLVGTLTAAALAVPVLCAVKRAQRSNPFRVIAGCAGAAILATQGALNVLGTVDLLPMTGVTLPFVSNGGTGMVAAWGFTAFIRAMERKDTWNG